MTHFEESLAKLDFFSKEPWALVRFADGERSIMERREVQAADGWTLPDQDFTNELNWAFAGAATWPDMHVGIACPCCDEPTYRYLAAKFVGCGGYHTKKFTYSNLFANANWERWIKRFKEELEGKCVFVPPGDNLVNAPDWSDKIDRAVWQLCNPDLPSGPILVAAGPGGKILIRRYWERAAKRRVIVDIGSALDPLILGRNTRGYHHPDHANRRKECSFA